jgi:hypothetical protein
MITRMWLGWTTSENADAYERFLLEELFPSMRNIIGFDGVELLRRVEGDEVGFVTLTRFEGLDAFVPSPATTTRPTRPARSARPTTPSEPSALHPRPTSCW